MHVPQALNWLATSLDGSIGVPSKVKQNKRFGLVLARYDFLLSAG
jgi:hypothetical protein